ncbi:unnamed protein product [Prunus brigantina]
MVLLNSLRVIPQEDHLGDDAIEQLVIEVFVDVFAIEPTEIFIDTSLVHGGMLIEAIENMEPNWDLYCGLEEMQFAEFVARTCVLHSHMHNTDTIRDDFRIYVDVLDEFDFKLAYMSTRHMDLEEWDATFGENGENLKAKAKREDEPMVETMAGIIMISSNDEEEPMEASEIEVILIESSDDKSMEEINGEVV